MQINLTGVWHQQAINKREYTNQRIDFELSAEEKYVSKCRDKFNESKIVCGSYWRFAKASDERNSNIYYKYVMIFLGAVSIKDVAVVYY